MRRNFQCLVVIAGYGTLAFAVGCETPKNTEVAPAPVAAAPVVEPPEADPTALCSMRLRVDDAVARGTIDELKTSLEAARAKNPDDRVASYGAIRAADNEKARWNGFKALDEAHPGSKVAALGVCEVYAVWKMDDQATKPCAEAASLDGNALVDVAYAEMAQQKGDAARANELLDEAFSKNASCAPAHVVRARVRVAEGNTEGALAAFDDALKVAPDCFSCLVEKAKLVEKTGGVKASLPVWEQALTLAPGHKDTLERLAAALVGDDDKRALEVYERALATKSPAYSTLMAAASLAARIDDLTKAADYAEKAAVVDPEQIDVWRLLLDVAEKRNEDAAKERASNEILRLIPTDGRAHLVLARKSRTDEQLASSLAHYDALQGSDDSGLSDDDKAAAAAERKALRAELAVPDVGPTGDANRVVNQVQRISRGVYEQRLKKNRSLKGALEVVIRTRGDGAVEEVNITNDELNDPYVAACVVGTLRVSRITGKAQRITVKLSFE